MHHDPPFEKIALGQWFPKCAVQGPPGGSVKHCQRVGNFSLWYSYSGGNSQRTIIKVKNSTILGLMSSCALSMESSGIKQLYSSNK